MSPDKKQWKELVKEIKEANKNPKFKKVVREFVRIHTGKTSS